MIELILMNESEFALYRSKAVENYAAENVRAGRAKVDSSLDESENAFTKLLPEGISTADHFIYKVCDRDAAVGMIWINLLKSEGMLWIYDLLVYGEYRRKGYGIQILRAIERKASEMDATRIGLHVFGHNPSAIELYEKAGYETTSIVMTRHLKT